MKVYIAGKISGLTPDKYHQKFELCKNFIKRFFKDDIEIIIPTEICSDDWDWEKCMSICVPVLQTCDLLLMMPDWVDSKGAKEEHNIAIKNNIPVWYL